MTILRYTHRACSKNRHNPVHIQCADCLFPDVYIPAVSQVKSSIASNMIHKLDLKQNVLVFAIH